jgi:sulfate permease, SulP family
MGTEHSGVRRRSVGLLGRLPLVASVRGSDARSLRDDAVAGVLVTAVAVPLSVGFAEVAGVPPVLGLYTCLLPMVGFALLGSSRHVKLGLDAASAAMFAAALAPLAVTVGSDTTRYLSLVALLTLLVGLFTLTAGLLRLGVIGDLLSLPVLVGYQTGIAVSVVIGQLPKLLGYAADGGNDLALAVDVLRNLGTTSATTLAVGATTLAAARLLRRRWPTLPAALLVLCAATAVSALLDLRAHGVAVVGDLPSGLPSLGLPAVTWDDVLTLAGPAAGIALVTSADVIVTSRSFATRLRYQVSPSQDLVGLGAANLLSGLTGGLSTSASYARTAISERTGSRTQLSSVVAALAMAAVLVSLTGPIALVPRAVLAAVVVDAVLGLVDTAGFRRLWHGRRAELAVAAFTTGGVLLLGLLPTLAVAVVWTVGLFLRRLVSAEDAVLGRREGSPDWQDVGRVTDAHPVPGLLLFRWDAPLFFANAGAFRTRLLSRLAEAEAAGPVAWVVVDGAAISELDLSAVAELETLADDLASRGITTAVVESSGAERDLLERTGFAAADRPGLLFDDLDAAVKAYQRRS